jgi:hypothetical protein
MSPRIRRSVVHLVIATSLITGGLGTVSAPPAQAFTGHHCTVSTCRYFTSSYSTAIYFYDRTTCSQWKSLSKTYLQGFRTKAALLSKFPHRRLHKPC